ncbi:MAG TPA: SDR family oxidoreductase [Flavisolibacter sp.]|nr:SDR family oxidoreductase [Flavisolibacter sp.]
MENAKPVLVVGATGFLGHEICQQLIALNKNVKGLVRTTSDPSKVDALRQMGVETVIGDIKDPGSLTHAFEGVGAVISTASSTLSHQEGDSIESVDRLGQLNVVDAAGKAFVEKFVFISFLESPESFPLQDAKREVEQKLIDSNMNYTILRPTFFMEVWLGPQLGFDAANHKATIYGHGVNKVSWISIKDVATFAVQSLTHPAAVNSIIDLGGPQALSPLEVVSLFEKETGHPFELQHVPEEALRTQKEVTPHPLQQSFSALMLTLSGGAAVPMEHILGQFPVTLRSVLDHSHILIGESAVKA